MDINYKIPIFKRIIICITYIFILLDHFYVFLKHGICIPMIVIFSLETLNYYFKTWKLVELMKIKKEE